MQYIHQLDRTDCGAACIAMIASHYGKHLSIAEVRSFAGTDLSGTNVMGLIQASEKYGLKARGVKGDREVIGPEVNGPFIANYEIKEKGEKVRDHFVIVKKITKKYITIWDPDPIEKKKKITYEEFFEKWTGYAVFIEPDERFKENEEKDNLLLKFIPIFLPHKKILIYSFLSSLLIMILGLISSFYYKYIFDEVIFAKAQTTLNTITIGILLVSLTQTVVGSIRSIFLSHFSYKTDLHLNFAYMNHILQLPISFFETRKTGEILSRLGDLSKVKGIVSGIALSSIMDIVMITISVPILFKISFVLSMVSTIPIILVSLVAFIFSKIYRKFYSKLMTENAEVSSFLYEAINGVATVKAMNAENLICYEYEKRKMISLNTSWIVNKYGIYHGVISGMINAITGIMVYWIGTSSIIQGSISFGTLMTFNSLLGYFTGPLYRIINVQNSIQEALVAARRVGEILELNREEINKKAIQRLNQKKNDVPLIKFNNVVFRYGSRMPIFENLSFEIRHGSWNAIVGESGSGKSTIIKLILKFYEIENGQILINGNDIRDINNKKLREKIGYVPQEIFLFSGTVSENIAMHYPNSTQEEIVDAAKRAGAHDFIERLPKRYETILGEHGSGLSGGEKQRLALARALLGKPTLMLLDEATSSLDSISEKQIHDVIKSLVKNDMTVILIAHRLSTVVNCDRIFVMESGKIVEKGTHKELLDKNGKYAKLWGE